MVRVAPVFIVLEMLMKAEWIGAKSTVSCMSTDE